MRRALGAAIAASALLAVGACAQLLGVESIPDGGRDAGQEASHDAGHDASHDASHDATGHMEGGAEAGCTTGSTRCSSDGIGYETCVGGAWTDEKLCSGTLPVCVNGACECVPGTGQCMGADLQHWQRCEVVDGGAPSLVPAGTCDSGTCTLAGCGPLPPSCAEPGSGHGITDCFTPSGSPTESCCTSNEIPGGSFYPSYDNVPPYQSQQGQAQVSGFRLDRFEVTVARFRPFAHAVQAGWAPAPGSGRHVHLNAGRGLAVEGLNGVYEPGWNVAWNSALTGSLASLSCAGATGAATWADAGPSSNDGHPINCVPWVAAYAFCIYDGGFLPSEAEWNYAAAGGSEQRYYPWSGPDSGLDAGCLANYLGKPNGQPCYGSATDQMTSPVGQFSKFGGDGEWLQADLAGNVWEWTLDAWLGPATQWPDTSACVDCVYVPVVADGGLEPDASAIRSIRGGAFTNNAEYVRVSQRGYSGGAQAPVTAGFRCARPP